jgi:hypothetical protein
VNPLPLYEPVPPAQELTVWYRLVTVLTSCYVYVCGHTALDPCRFEVAPTGQAACYVAEQRLWEVTLPEAAYRQLEAVVRLWHAGLLPRCEQLDSIRLGEPQLLPSQQLSVAVLPAIAPRRRAQTLARREVAAR